jgi:tRNA-binding protein
MNQNDRVQEDIKFIKSLVKMEPQIEFSDFLKVDIRVGTVISARYLENANKPAIILEISFGKLGVLKSSAQITNFYTPENMLHKQVLAVVNFPPKQIGAVMSQCLVLGLKMDEGPVVLLTADKNVEEGIRVT